MAKESFLCSNCRREMCDDCREIAEEYQTLLKLRTDALMAANARVESLERELASMKSCAAMYKEISQAGIGKIISAWMDKEIGRLLKGEQPSVVV